MGVVGVTIQLVSLFVMLSLFMGMINLAVALEYRTAQNLNAINGIVYSLQERQINQIQNLVETSNLGAY